MTNLTRFQQNSLNFWPDIELRFWEPMAKHTSFRIGGGVKSWLSPRAVRS